MIHHFACEILIIGAGLAGLTAGYDLASRGYDVKIVESHNHVGGRVSTAHLSDGTHFEKGAFSFGDGEHPLWDYVQKFNLPVIKHTPIQRSFRFKNFTGTVDEKAFFLNSKEQEIILAELFDYFRPALEKITEDMSFDKALKFVGASDEAIEWLQAMTLFGLLGNNFQELSTKAALAFMKQYDDSTAFYALKGGNDQLPQAFAQHLEDKMYLNHGVQKIEQLQDTCLVTGAAFTAQAKNVILAIPLPALNKIDFQPTLSLEKQAAIQLVSYTPCARLSIIAPAHIVSNSPQGGVFLFSDQLGWLRDQSAFQQDTEKKTVINTSVAGDKAKKMMGSIEQWKDDMNDFFCKAYPSWDQKKADYYPTILEQAYSSFSVDAYKQKKHLGSPKGRLYFAGEHTNKNFASMNGAIQSGIRVAQEVLSSLSNTR